MTMIPSAVLMEGPSVIGRERSLLEGRALCRKA